jgi:hypothetical protein
MKQNLALSIWFLCHLPAAALAAELKLSSPLDYQVIQRESKEKGRIFITATTPGAEAKDVVLQGRLVSGKKPGDWVGGATVVSQQQISTSMEAPAGGWYRLEVRAVVAGKVIAESVVEHVGVGEVFVVAGQSNSANHGEEKQTTKTGRIATFDGKQWKLANDPQPGASGGGGSFLPPFGDAMVEKFGVPIGFVSCGIGATSVREWLPKGTTFPNPPTLTGRVQQRPDGQWESKGEAFDMFVGRIIPLGKAGFRAVLWHQGESDANQRDSTRTLPGNLYRKYLEQVIRESNKGVVWEAPWFVAQVSYHVPGDEASPDIRDAQASLWRDGVALEGPDSDALKGPLREGGGKGVHFSGAGLKEHGKRWAEKVAPWVERRLSSEPPRENPQKQN